MNRGLEIRQKKLEKNAKKRHEIKERQVNLVRFVTIRWEVIERINGKYRRTGNATANGLQIENKVYMMDGHYKFINSKSVKIMEIYKEIPEWASEELINKYREALEKE